jgi:hypothetical protein
MESEENQRRDFFKRRSDDVQSYVQMPDTAFKYGSSFHDFSLQKSRVKGG